MSYVRIYHCNISHYFVLPISHLCVLPPIPPEEGLKNQHTRFYLPQEGSEVKQRTQRGGQGRIFLYCLIAPAIKNATENCIFVYVRSACFVHNVGKYLLQHTNVSRTRRSHTNTDGIFIRLCVNRDFSCTFNHQNSVTLIFFIHEKNPFCSCSYFTVSVSVFATASLLQQLHCIGLCAGL